LNSRDVNEIAQELPGLLPEFEAGFRSFLSVPLFSRDRTLGGLHFRSKTEGAYSDLDVKLAESIGHQIAGAVLNSQLISDVKQNYRKVQESEERYRVLLQAVGQAGDALVMVASADGKEGQIVFANLKAQEITGYSLGDLRHLSWMDIIVPSFRDEVRTRLQRRMMGENLPGIYEIAIRHRDGQEIPIEISATTCKFAEESAVISLFREITARKQAEAALKESEAKFQDLFDAAPAIYLEIDSRGILTGINKTGLSMLGYDREELIGQPIWKLSLDEELSRQSVLAKLTGGKPPGKGFERIYRRKDGTTFSVSIEDRILKDREGRIIGMRSIIQDNSEKRLLENQLAQSHKLEAVGQLAAGIAHEINTPIQYVGDNTRFFRDAFQDLHLLSQKYEQLYQTLRNHGETTSLLAEVEAVYKRIDPVYLHQEIPKAIQQTLEGVERVTHIVRAMKEFSHPGMKEKTAIDLNRAIQNTVTVARNEWKYVADLEMDLDPSIPPALCLPGEINQVLLNLIVNAAHAIADNLENHPSGKGTILIRTSGDEQCVEIRITDTGKGIPEEIRERIFEPFFTTKPMGKGTGQGLAIAHNVIVKKHGGTIHFESAMEKGTTFFIRLPINGQANSENRNLAPIPDPGIQKADEKSPEEMGGG
jgi:PAS domain S-box-containing protein